MLETRRGTKKEGETYWTLLYDWDQNNVTSKDLDLTLTNLMFRMPF